MSADPDDIVRATRVAQVVTLVDPALLAQVPSARDAATAPDAGYFENAADARAALVIKATLVGTFRQRYLVRCAPDSAHALPVDPLVKIPTVQLVDSELALDRLALPSRLQLDLEDDSVTVEVIG